MLNDDSAGLPLRSWLFAKGLMGMSRIGADPKRCKLGRLDGAFVFMIEFCAAENGLASVVAVADRARMIGGGVGREPPGEARRFGMMDASRD